MQTIVHAFAAITDPDYPARMAGEIVQFGQQEAFFRLAAVKESRWQQLRANLGGRLPQKIVLSANLSGFDCQQPGCTVDILEADFLTAATDEAGRQRQRARLADSVVLINNNDLGTPERRAAYLALYEGCVSTVFVGWDWDNHHWLDLSTFMAAHTDLYCPAHHENLYVLSRYNWLTAGPVYCTSVQWPRRFLCEQLPDILTRERSDAPLGMHIPYQQFAFRLQVISTLSQFYPSIGFSSRSFHVRTLHDRLDEWCAHKSHWISPVLNDVPIRIFDALVSGGIPLVPASLRFMLPVRDIPEAHVVFYSTHDIVAPARLVAEANEKFEQGGRDGMVARHRLALDAFHGETSVAQMLAFAAQALG